jgi:hypothetical protein
MRDYGVVSPKFWIGETGKSLRGNPEAQIVALYLMTCPHANMIGVFHCPLVYISHETGLTFEGASKALASLSEARFLTYDDATETVFVHRMAAYQVGESLKAEDNRVKSVIKEWHSIGHRGLQAAFFAIYSIAFHLPAEEKKASPSKAPKKPLRSQEQEQEQDKTIAPPSAEPPGFVMFWNAWPKSDRKEAKGKCRDVWVKENLEHEADVVLAHVESKKASVGWTKNRGEFIPAPVVYLNKRSWDGADLGESVAEERVGNFI